MGPRKPVSMLRRGATLVGDVGGAVTTEYVVVVATMGFALMFALVALGPKMVQGYQQNRASIASPFP